MPSRESPVRCLAHLPITTIYTVPTYADRKKFSFDTLHIYEHSCSHLRGYSSHIISVAVDGTSPYELFENEISTFAVCRRQSYSPLRNLLFARKTNSRRLTLQNFDELVDRLAAPRRATPRHAASISLSIARGDATRRRAGERAKLATIKVD